MAWELLLWLLAFVAIIALIALCGYQDVDGKGKKPKPYCIPIVYQPTYAYNMLICLSDLEFDYINPYDLSSRVNAVVIPEFMVQGILCILFLLTWHWFPFLVMAPITYNHIKLFMRRKYLIDVTEIFRMLNEEKKYRIIKLALYGCIFIVVIYRLVMTAVLLLIEEDDGILESGIV